MGASVLATNPTAPSLPDVQVPAIQLSNAEGADSTAAWLELFTQASGNNADSLGTNLQDLGPAALPGQTPLVVIDPQNPAQDFEGILDGVVGKMGSPMDAVTSAINGPDAVTYLILNNNGS
ncbi:MAG: hypothetical protein ACRDTN_06800 [Mycobacterium sp.]